MDIFCKTGVLQNFLGVCRKANLRREVKALFMEYYIRL
jgi:molybdopterin synthase catalytic subunit